VQAHKDSSSERVLDTVSLGLTFHHIHKRVLARLAGLLLLETADEELKLRLELEQLLVLLQQLLLMLRECTGALQLVVGACVIDLRQELLLAALQPAVQLV
jgi:hypothetical protein